MFPKKTFISCGIRVISVDDCKAFDDLHGYFQQKQENKANGKSNLKAYIILLL